MAFFYYYCFLLSWAGIYFVKGVKFNSETSSETEFLANEGKIQLESLREKANVPQYGPCWKNAIADLQVSCKYLSEDLQSRLALRFTDCFLQMSGYEPVTCDFQKATCLKKLSDRAFYAYTEFYTHTQSICYFLQSQVWHEETEKTVEKLWSTSQYASQKLEEAEETQNKLLQQQRDSLLLQYELFSSSQNVADALKLSQDKIKSIMSDFQNSAIEQKQLLLDVFEHLLSFKSWAFDEMSWFSSTIFYVAVLIVGFLFTSVSRTKGARIFVIIIFSLNYLLERFLTNKTLAGNIYFSNISIATETLYAWVWLCRKFCISLSIIITICVAINYYDYNLLNYKLLLEIRNQNLKILNQLSTSNSINNKSKSDLYQKCKSFNLHDDSNKSKLNNNRNYLNSGSEFTNQNFQGNLNNSNSYSDIFRHDTTFLYTSDVVDHTKNDNKKNEDEISIASEKTNLPQEFKSKYNLRRSTIKRA